MLETILVPDIGDYSNVTVIEVLVKIGDIIKKESELICLETDKATMEIPSPKSGIIKELCTKVGDKISKDSPILILESSDDNDHIISSTKETSTTTNYKSAVKINSNETSTKNKLKELNNLNTFMQKNRKISEYKSKEDMEIYAGPSTRRFARELGVDLNQIHGTGRKGRIIKNDVKNFIQNSLNDNIMKPPVLEIDFKKFGDVEIHSLDRIQKKTGRILHSCWNNIPHVTQFDEADITELENFRKEQKEHAAQKDLKLTLFVFLMKALVKCLKEFPKFNTSIIANGEKLVYKKYYNIGIAVDTSYGLVVPVIRHVDSKNLFQLATDLKLISQKARDGKLSGHDMQGSCLTISSLGGIGGTAFTPIINAPEVAILGVSKAQKKPVYINNELMPRLILPISLSYDHRVINGADAARFTTFMIHLLNDIRRLLL